MITKIASSKLCVLRASVREKIDKTEYYRAGKKTWNIARNVSDGGGVVVLRLGKQ